VLRIYIRRLFDCGEGTELTSMEPVLRYFPKSISHVLHIYVRVRVRYGFYNRLPRPISFSDGKKRVRLDEYDMFCICGKYIYECLFKSE